MAPNAMKATARSKIIRSNMVLSLLVSNIMAALAKPYHFEGIVIAQVVMTLRLTFLATVLAIRWSDQFSCFHGVSNFLVGVTASTNVVGGLIFAAWVFPFYIF